MLPMLRNWKFGLCVLLISQFLERLAYYSVYSVLMFLLISEPFHWSTYNSIAAVLLLSGFSYIATMVGGLLSDTVISKQITVLIGYVLYSFYVGYVFVFHRSSDCPNSDHRDRSRLITDECSAPILFPVIIITGIASGLIKSVIASMGADIAIKNKYSVSMFFNLYYWFINAGSLIAYGVIGFVLQNMSAFAGVIPAAVCLVVSFILFLFGFPSYVKLEKPETSTLKLVFKIYMEAWSKQRQVSFIDSQKAKFEKSSDVITSEEEDNDSIHEPLFGSVNHSSSSKNKFNEFSNHYTRKMSESVQVTSGGVIQSPSSIREQQNDFLDYSKTRLGGTFQEEEVENVRKFTKVVFGLLFMLPYWILYFQMNSTYLSQSLQMDLQAFKNYFTLPVSWLSMTDIILVMCLIPIFAKFIYPFLEKINRSPSQEIKIIIGMIFAVLSLYAAGVLEIYTMKSMDDNNFTQLIGSQNFTSARLSVFYQLFQYTLMGISEVLTVVSALEIACTRVPKSMQGLTNGIFWFISGIGSFIGSGLLKIYDAIAGQHNNDLSHYNLSNYFFILPSIQIFSLILFVIWIKAKRKRKSKTIYEIYHTRSLD